MKRTYVDVGDRQVHATFGGKTGQRIVLLHESPLSNRVYENAFQHLDNWSRYFAPDTPGYGKSDPISRDATMDKYAALLSQAIKQWADGEKVVIVGIHTGASVAIEIAAQYPEICQGLFLIGVPVYNESDRADRIANWCPDISIGVNGEHLQWAWNRYVKIWPTAPIEFRNLAVNEMLNVWDRYNWGYQQAFVYDVKTQIQKVTCPIQIAAAAGEFLHNASQDLAKEFDKPFVTFAGLDGQVPLRNPELFVSELRKFCESI